MLDLICNIVLVLSSSLLGAIVGIWGFVAVESAKYEETYLECKNCPNKDCCMRLEESED